MQTGSHPLTPTRRLGQIISVTMTPSPTVEVAVGGDPSTTVFVPFLDSYAPHVGDYVVLLGTQGDYVVVGSVNAAPISWSANGPSGLSDYGTGNNVVCSVSVPIISGRYYKIAGYILGTQITATGTPFVRLTVGGVEPTPRVALVQLPSAPANEVEAGYAAYRYLATSTASVTFAVVAGVTASGSAFRVQAGAAQITVEDNGV